jgi:hypothetical protein
MTTNLVTQNTCLGLFQRHHLPFSFSIAAALARQSGQLTLEEWSYLLKGSSSQSDEYTSACPIPNVLPQQVWQSLQQLAGHVPRFRSVTRSCSSLASFWERYMTSEEPWVLKPDDWKMQNSEVHWNIVDHMLVAKCCAPQHLAPCVQVSLHATVFMLFNREICTSVHTVMAF